MVEKAAKQGLRHSTLLRTAQAQPCSGAPRTLTCTWPLLVWKHSGLGSQAGLQFAGKKDLRIVLSLSRQISFLFITCRKTIIYMSNTECKEIGTCYSGICLCVRSLNHSTRIYGTPTWCRAPCSRDVNNTDNETKVA